MKKIVFLCLTLTLCTPIFTACEFPLAETTSTMETPAVTTIASTTPYPQPNPVSDFVFEESQNSDSFYVKRYVGSNPIAVIPAEVDGKPVVSIRSIYSDEVEVLWVPDSVVDIRSLDGLSGCGSLREVHLGKGVQHIYAKAFYKCKALEAIAIPEGVNTIQISAFRECTSLRSITIPSTVTKWGDEIFSYSTALEEVILQEGIETVGAFGVFWGCESLHELTFPKSVKYVGECTLANSGVTKVTFLGDAPEFGDGALETRKGNVTVYYPKDAKGWENLSFENVTFVPY